MNNNANRNHQNITEWIDAISGLISAVAVVYTIVRDKRRDRDNKG